MSKLTLTSDHKLLVSGQLTFNTVNKLWEESKVLLEQMSSIEVDLEQAEQTDSAGLSLLMEWFRYAKQQGKSIVFRHLPIQLMNIAKTSGIDAVLPMEDSTK